MIISGCSISGTSISGSCVLSNIVYDELISEIVGINDLASNELIPLIVVLESLGLGDSATLQLYKFVQEALGISDSPTSSVRSTDVTVEQLALSDTAAETVRFIALGTDSVGISDTGILNLRSLNTIQEALQFGALLEIAGELYTGWVVNAETFGATTYEDFSFESLCEYDGKYYGAKSDGIYLLEGELDEAEYISARCKLGLLDFGTSALKNVREAYLGYRSTGALVLKVVTGEKVERWYEFVNTEDRFVTERQKLGRGVKARYWQFELVNKDGADFELADMELLPVRLTRRLGGTE